MEAVFLAPNQTLYTVLKRPSAETDDEILRSAEQQIRQLESDLSGAPQRVEEILNSRRHELLTAQQRIEELRNSNVSLVHEIAQLSERLKTLESLAVTANQQVHNSFDTSKIRTAAISAEAELSAARGELRAFQSKNNELRLRVEGLQKQADRLEAQALDDTTSAVAQIQKLQSRIDEESAKTQTLQRHIAQREDCNSMLITMQSKSMAAQAMHDDYQTQTERLLRDFDALCMEIADRRDSASKEKARLQDEVDTAARQCRRLEQELRDQAESMQVALSLQQEKSRGEVALLKEMQKMIHDELQDLERDAAVLKEQQAHLEKDNTNLAVMLHHHSLDRDAKEYLDGGDQKRKTPSVVFLPRDDDEITIRTTGGKFSAACSALGANNDELTQKYLMALRVQVGVLDKELQRVSSEKDSTATQLELLTERVTDDAHQRRQELALLRSEVDFVSVHHELKAAKLEHVSLMSVLRDRIAAEESAEDDVSIQNASLKATIEELKRRISELTSASLEKERMQQCELDKQRDTLRTAQRSYELALSAEARGNEMKKKLESLEEDNKRLKDFFRVPDPSTFVDATNSLPSK